MHIYYIRTTCFPLGSFPQHITILLRMIQNVPEIWSASWYRIFWCHWWEKTCFLLMYNIYIYIVILCYTIMYKGFGPNRKSVSVQPSIFAAQWSWANVLKCILEYWSVLACFSDQTLGIEQHTGPPLNHWRLNRPWGYNMIQPILVDRYSMVFVWWHQIIPRIASPTSTLAAGTNSKVEPCCPDGSPASGNMR